MAKLLLSHNEAAYQAATKMLGETGKAATYRKTFDTMDVPVLYRTGDGFPLGEWLRTQVKFEAAGKLKKERKALLERLGVRWKNAQPNQGMRDKSYPIRQSERPIL